MTTPPPNPGIPAYDLPMPTRTPWVPGLCGVCRKPTEPHTPLRRTPWGNVPDPHAACRAKVVAERAAREAAALAGPTAEWEQVRDRHRESPALLAVLDLHRPVVGGYEVGCGECKEYDRDGDAEPATWPCGTFAAIREAEGDAEQDVHDDMLERYVAATSALRANIMRMISGMPAGHPAAIRRPSPDGRCYEASWGWVHVKPGCRCGRR